MAISSPLASPAAATAFPVTASNERGFRWAAIGLVAVLVATTIAVAIPRLVAEREQGILLGIEARQSALARGRAEVIATWVEGVEAPAARLTDSPSIKLFAQEMQLATRDGLLASALREQLPYMQLVIEEFARQAGLSGAGLLGSRGEWLVADGQIRLSASARAAIAAARPDHRLVRLTTDDAPELVLAVPITSLVEGRDDPGAVTARLVMVVPAKERLHAVLGARVLDAPGEHAGLLLEQRGGELLLLDEAGGVAPAPAGWERLRQGSATLQSRPGLRGAELLMVGTKVPDLDWTVVQWLDRATGLQAVTAFARQAWLIACLAGSALMAAIVGLGWLLDGRHQRAFTYQYRQLAEQIERQRRLLDDITGAVPEMIGLKDEEGRYRFANRAFCLALGRSPEQVVGRTDAELFGEAGAAVLNHVGGSATLSRSAQSLEERLPIGGRERIVNLAKVPFVDSANRTNGMLTIVTDVTELARERASRDRLQRETVEAFTRAVERTDPWLSGHTRRLRELAAALGRKLALDPATLTTIDLAAALSQVGKFFVPKEILLKPERLDAAEVLVMQTHLDHALAILGDVEFDVPVTTALAQMHERLDGSGYPKAIAGDAIGMAARVLAVADVFCARTAPRSYREAIEAGAALDILLGNCSRYDADVVRALLAHVAAERPTV